LKPEPKVELKPEPKVELKPEPKVELKPEERSTQEISNDDPFAGISTQDIEKYSDIFDVSPPESDDQARKLAADIKKWISAGRPKSKPKDEPKSKPEPEMKSKDESEDELEEEHKQEKDEKPIKKRSLFGWIKK
ncbi:MAG: signal recognition particle-docking protein FtsY, partial [Thaumarchaeota archaeon]|nr:signal recognition particle-docking protein FtsY [Nitrososphaerota archaeon]